MYLKEEILRVYIHDNRQEKNNCLNNQVGQDSQDGNSTDKEENLKNYKVL